MLADQWRFILFDPRPKSIGTALKTIQAGLADGDAVGIFCEGGISRTGQILGFKRGLEWLLEKVESPIVPVSIDGLWGSGLSFSEGRFVTKWPRLGRRTVTVTFGPALPAGTHPDVARLALQETAAGAVAARLAPDAATAEAFDGCCLVRRDDRLLASLAAGDPLHDSLGLQGGRLLGIRGTVIDHGAPAATILDTLDRSQATIWLARVEQVLAAAGEPARGDLAAHLTAVVMPIGHAADLPRAREAIDRFRETHGVEPVVAYAPPEVDGLVAMNTPPARMSWNHETIHRPESVGRVVNGVAIWPRVAERTAAGLPPLVATDVAADAPATLAIAATAGRRPATAAILLADAFRVDKDGFLVPDPDARTPPPG
jgi:hypothetical protein